jgi:hypothetical protein
MVCRGASLALGVSNRRIPRNAMVPSTNSPPVPPIAWGVTKLAATARPAVPAIVHMSAPVEIARASHKTPSSTSRNPATDARAARGNPKKAPNPTTTTPAANAPHQMARAPTRGAGAGRLT